MNINNILEDTIQRFFTESNDISFNYLREWINIPQSEPQNVSDTDSIPDLIDPTMSAPPAPPSDHGMQMWSNMINDYHSQMRMYQENIRTILDITQNFLPQNRNPPSSQGNNNSFWRDLLRNNTYSLEIERILPSLFTNTNNIPPTASQISSTTTNFTYDISNNPLISNQCPISLEEFQDGEQLTRIIRCGHVFKTTELSRWFLRNSHCPSCRYDIRRNG